MIQDLLDSAAAAAISAVVLGGFAWAIFRAGIWERKANFRRALREPAKYPRWKKEDITRWRDHVLVIKEHFESEANTRSFSSDELRAIEAFSPDLRPYFEKHRHLTIAEAIGNTQQDVEGRYAPSTKVE